MVPWFVVQVVADGDLLGYPIYLVRFAPVAPFSSSAVGSDRQDDEVFGGNRLPGWCTSVSRLARPAMVPDV